METLDSFEIENSGDHLWTALSKHTYSNRAIQAATELIDNAISAILALLAALTTAGGSQRMILFDFDDKTETASIEDNGPGFPVDRAALGRCWSFGFAKPGGLNEHGCGAKTSLSIFDPNGRGWKVYWKTQGSPIVYCIQGPLRTSMKVVQGSTWPGKLTDSSGVYMSFPCSKECFRALYGSNAKKMEDAIPRFRRELAQIYYFRPELMNGLIHLVVNGMRVEPFTIDFASSCVRAHKKQTFKLGQNKGTAIGLELAGELKDSWFKCNTTSLGIYFWKNGRFISHVNSGETFKILTGHAAHPSMNGKFLLVNLEGDQSSLPPTDPNKSTWNVNHDAFQELIRQLSPIATEFFAKNVEDDYERDHVKEFVETRRTTFEGMVPGYICSVGETFHGKTPQIDIVETFPERKTLRIYEAKRRNQAGIEDISQLVTNYQLTKNELKGSERTIEKAILLLNCTREDKPVNAKLDEWMCVLKEANGIPLEVHSFKYGLLWPSTDPKPVPAPKAKKSKQSTASGTA